MPPPGLAAAPPPPNATTPSAATVTTSVLAGGANTPCTVQNQTHMPPSTPTQQSGGNTTNNSAYARKKTSFQITSVKVHDGGVHERDEAVDANIENIDHSAVGTASINQAPHQNGGATDTGPQDTKGGPVKEHSISDPQAVADQWSRRFRVVKIPFSEPFKRGRWTCTDFFDPLEQKQEEKQAQNQMNTSPGDGEGPTETNDSQVREGTPGGTGATPEDSQPSHPVGSALTPAPTQTPAPTPQGDATTDGNYAACGAGSIDKKIEQAMDLVKSHLIFAVREEVDVLREKITELNERNEQLSQENQTLRSLLTPEQAQRFTVLQQQQLKPSTRSTQAPPSSMPAAQSIPRTAPSLAAFAVSGRSGGVSTPLGIVAPQGAPKPVVLPLATTALTSNTVTSSVTSPSAVSSPNGQQPTASLPASLLMNATPTKELSPPGGVKQ